MTQSASATKDWASTVWTRRAALTMMDGPERIASPWPSSACSASAACRRVESGWDRLLRGGQAV